MTSKLTNITLPAAMIVGVLFHEWLSFLSWLPPVLIFLMLLLTFSSISLKTLRFTRLHAIILSVQLGGSLGIYALLQPYDPILAQGALLCIMAPVATAAPVITKMLGGNVAFTISYCFLSNLAVAFAAPLIFSYIGPHSTMGFADAFLFICRQVMPLLVLPLFFAWCLQKYSPRGIALMMRLQPLSFYMWACSLTVVLGNACNFALLQPRSDFFTEFSLAFLALVLCIILFVAGKLIGSQYNETIGSGQAMGQKNTVLAIWMALSYANPLASLAPAAYIIWQNAFNAFQLWRYNRRT